MVKDEQVRILMKLINQDKTLEVAAAKSGMSEKTARKYRRSGKLPSQCRVDHIWRTREDYFRSPPADAAGQIPGRPTADPATADQVLACH